MSSDMRRANRSLETTKNAKNFLPSFYSRGEIDTKKKKSLAWCMHGVPPEILAAFELPWEWPENFGTLCAARQVAVNFIEVAEADGYSPELCSYLLNTMGYLRRHEELGTVPPESPLKRGMGDPTMLLGSGYACDPRYKWFQAAGTRFHKEVPVFNSDPLSPAFDVNLSNPRIREHYLDILRRDLKEQVAFLEEQMQIKLDLGKLREIVRNSLKAEKYYYQALELCKAVPSPMGAPDYFTSIIPQLYMMGTNEAVNFYRSLYEEVKHRVENKIGVLEEEKHRFIWMGIPPWYNLGLFNYFESLGVVFPIATTYYVGKFHDVDIEDPLEALVQRSWQKAVWYCKTGSQAIPETFNYAISTSFVGTDLVRQWVKEYQLDGAIMHRTRSCRAVSVGQVFYRNILAEEGIQSLILESDMADPRQWADAKIKNLIQAYIETIEA